MNAFVAESLESRRLLAAGGIDPSFGDAGVLTLLGSDGNASGLSVARQPDGKVLTLAGRRPNFPYVTLTRYNTNGHRDKTFGNGGRIVFPSDVMSAPGPILVQDDGKILIAGELGAEGRYGLMRYTAAGKLDAKFGNKGVAAVRGERIVSLAIARKRILAARFRSGFQVDRWLLNGKPDRLFGDNGVVVSEFPFDEGSKSFCESVVVQPDGGIVVSGNANEDFALARYTWAGELDTTFNGTGTITTDFGPSSEAITTVYIQPDGKLLACGRHVGDTGYTYALARYLPDGRLDESFGDHGLLIAAIGAARAVAVQSNGKIVIAGPTDDSDCSHGEDRDIIMGRYNGDGSVDTTFGNGGRVHIDFQDGQDDPRYLMIEPRSGKLLLFAISTRPRKAFLVEARYLWK